MNVSSWDDRTIGILFTPAQHKVLLHGNCPIKKKNRDFVYLHTQYPIVCIMDISRKKLKSSFLMRKDPVPTFKNYFELGEKSARAELLEKQVSKNITASGKQFLVKNETA